MIDKMRIINKTFLNLKDISVLMECGQSKASWYRQNYIKKKKLEQDFFKIQIPTSDFLKFYKIDINLIRENYLIESEVINRA